MWHFFHHYWRWFDFYHYYTGEGFFLELIKGVREAEKQVPFSMWGIVIALILLLSIFWLLGEVIYLIS